MKTKISALVAVSLLVCAFDIHAMDGQAPPPRAATPCAWDAPPVTGARLSALRGGAAVSANVSLNGSLQNTSATNVTSGANSIAGGSFANASGLPTVIQNSGANVVIQNSTVVNVLFKP